MSWDAPPGDLFQIIHERRAKLDGVRICVDYRMVQARADFRRPRRTGLQRFNIQRHDANLL
jgi:hypothetical protein